MFDKAMFWVYSFTINYHALRGGGLTKLQAIKGAYTTVSESEVAKPVSDFQKNMWAGMKQIAEEKKL